MWLARTKTDLMIEVWEKLDCENVGAAEIEAIEAVVADQYGRSAVDSPMTIARLLADEGADLRHAEIMTLYVERISDRPYDAAFRNILNICDLRAAERSIRDLENLRLKYKSENDKEGLRLVGKTARNGKETAAANAARAKPDTAAYLENIEIERCFRVWLETPEIFDDWLSLRRHSPEFIKNFGEGKDAVE